MSGDKKPRFIKEQEASALLSSLGIEAPLTKIPLVGLFCFRSPNKLIQVIKSMTKETSFYLQEKNSGLERHLRNLDLPTVLVGNFLETQKEYRNSKR